MTQATRGTQLKLQEAAAIFFSFPFLLGFGPTKRVIPNDLMVPRSGNMVD